MPEAKNQQPDAEVLGKSKSDRHLNRIKRRGLTVLSDLFVIAHV